MAREMGPGHTIVTILCDYGTRYQSKMFNPAFLREKGLPVPDWLAGEPRDCRRSTSKPMAMLRRILALALLWLTLALAAVAQEPAEQPDYEAWQRVADRAESVIDAARASDPALRNAARGVSSTGAIGSCGDRTSMPPGSKPCARRSTALGPLPEEGAR